MVNFAVIQIEYCFAISSVKLKYIALKLPNDSLMIINHLPIELLLEISAPSS